MPASAECAAVMAAGATGRCWKGSIPISARKGAQELTIAWNESRGSVGGQNCTQGQGCNGTFPGIAQQAYTADDLPNNNISGPLQMVQINACPTAACLAQGNSLPLGAGAPPVAVTIGLRGALENAHLSTPSTMGPLALGHPVRSKTFLTTRHTNSLGNARLSLQATRLLWSLRESTGAFSERPRHRLVQHTANSATTTGQCTTRPILPVGLASRRGIRGLSAYT